MFKMVEKQFDSAVLEELGAAMEKEKKNLDSRIRPLGRASNPS